MNERLAAEVRSLLSEDILEYAFPGLGDGCVLHEELCEDMLRELIAEPFAEPSNDELDPRTIEIIAQLQALKERYGLSDGELDRLLGYTVRPSRLRITHSGRLLLEDFDGKEVRMDSLCKAVFFRDRREEPRPSLQLHREQLHPREGLPHQARLRERGREPHCLLLLHHRQSRRAQKNLPRQDSCRLGMTETVKLVTDYD